MLPKSLKNLILCHEIAILFLVAVTGMIGVSTAYFWQHNSVESLRINAMFFLSEQIRGELYAQIQEMIRARILEDKRAFEAYPEYSRSISKRFNQLRRRSHSREEDIAIQKLNQSYREIQHSMNNIFINPYIASRLARMQTLDPQFAQGMVSKFEERHKDFKKILSQQHEKLDEILTEWTQFAPFIIPIPFIIAIMIVLYTRRVVQKNFIKPIENIMRGARAISHDELDYRIDEDGVEEVSNLVIAINTMAEKLENNRNTLVENERQVALGSLVPVVAHNIRNPLASIRATAQLLEYAENQEEIDETKNEIIDTIDRLGRWVSSLVSYLHPLKPNLVLTKPTKLVNAALGLLVNKIEEKEIRIIKQGWENDHSLNADPDLMEQALYSLLNNAIEATPRGGLIKISFTCPEEYVEIHIIDSGPGLPFQPKSGDLEPGPSTKRFGTGLGIPVAFKICQKHGWNLQFHVQECEGTEVIIAAPIHQIREVKSS